MRRVRPPQSHCKFGVARADITPPVGTYHRMWGAALHDRSEGIHRPLTATAMCMGSNDHPDDRQFLIAIDHCLFGYHEVESLLSQ